MSKAWLTFARHSLQACLLACSVVGLSHALAEEEDWKAALQEKSSDGAADTGVLGLSAEERESLLSSQTDGEPDSEEPENFVRHRRRFVPGDGDGRRSFLRPPVRGRRR